VDFSLLVVCTANVCRSPAAAALAKAAAARVGFGIGVESAGTGDGGETFGVESCAQMSQILACVADVKVPQGFSQRLTYELVRRADLVLTADRRHRGEVVRTAPQHRDRVFTILEAAALAGSPALRLTPRGGSVTAESLRSVVAELDAVRGVGPIPRGEALDLPDPHLDRVAHEAVLSPLLEAMRRLLGTLFHPRP
jgi:protein-tyrosine phosphatase